MSILFEPLTLGTVPIRNRFVHSATYEGLATEGGEVTDALVNRHRRLARGEVGLVIPGGLHVHPLGRSSWGQAGIDRDDLIPGLRQIVDAVHQGGAAGSSFNCSTPGRRPSRRSPAIPRWAHRPPCGTRPLCASPRP